MKYLKLLFVVLVIMVIGLSADAIAQQLARVQSDDRQLSFETDLSGDGRPYEVALVIRAPDRDGDVMATAAISVKWDGGSLLKEVGLINRHRGGIEPISAGPGQKNFVALSYPVGVSGWRVNLYGLDGDTLSEELSLYSDRPSIIVKQSSQTGGCEIEVSSRVGKAGPGEDIVTLHRYVDGKWQVSSNENGDNDSAPGPGH